jgi:hypothetical protein
MGFLKTMQMRRSVDNWAALQVGVKEKAELFRWAMGLSGGREWDDNPDNARKVGRLVGIASFTVDGHVITKRGTDFVDVFRYWEENQPAALVSAFREGKAQGIAEAQAKIAEFGA